MKFLIREIMLFIFQTIGIAPLKIMFGQWKMPGPNDIVRWVFPSRRERDSSLTGILAGVVTRSCM